MGYPNLSLIAPRPIKFHGDLHSKIHINPQIWMPLWWTWNRTLWRRFIKPCDEPELELYGNTYSEPYNGAKSGLIDWNNLLPLHESFFIDAFVVGVRWRCRWQSLLMVVAACLRWGQHLGCALSVFTAPIGLGYFPKLIVKVIR